MRASSEYIFTIIMLSALFDNCFPRVSSFSSFYAIHVKFVIIFYIWNSFAEGLLFGEAI